MVCIACGKEGVETFEIRSAFLPKDWHVCANCLLRYGDRKLGGEADRLMLDWQRESRPLCAKCGKDVLYVTPSEVRLYCGRCEEEIRQQFRELIK